MNLLDLLADAILSTRLDAIIAGDREGIIRFWNPRTERIFGHASAGQLLFWSPTSLHYERAFVSSVYLSHTGATDMSNHDAAIKMIKMQGGVFG